MSQIAGRLSVQEGAKYLEKLYGGSGVLLSGVPGTPRANVVILGGGSVGTNACKIAVGMGANVTIMDINIHRLEYLDDIFGARVQTLYSNDVNVENALKTADLVVGAVLIPGKKAPKIIRRSYLREMRPGSVIVDVAVDLSRRPNLQGGRCRSLLCRQYAGRSSKDLDHRTDQCDTGLWSAAGRAWFGGSLPQGRTALLGSQHL